jgi:tRNA(Ile)-lysidine synthase
MNTEYKNITNNIEEVFKNFFIKKQIAVAISGGCDSVALTFALNDFCKESKIKIYALTIDHGVRKNSKNEAKKVGELLKEFNISHKILSIPKKEIPQKNIEANLREIRYKMLSDFCKKNHIEFLFVGHHLGDIAENFLIRLFRGSGLDGLSPMQEISEINGIKIIRPFLEISKDELKNYLIAKNIAWFEDETNDDEKFLRNKIRKFLASFDDKNLLEKRIYNASKEISKTRDFFDEIMEERALEIIEENTDNLTLINRRKLAEINSSIALKILAKILMKIGDKKYKPRKEKLLRFYEYLIAEGVIKKREFYGCVVEKYQDEKVKIYKK